MRGKISAMLVLLFVAVLVGTANAVVVTFENPSFVEGQYVYEYGGISFRNAIIAEELSGTAYGFFTGSYPDRTDDEVLGTDAVGGFMITDSLGDDDRYPFLDASPISWRYDVPATETSFYLIDIDARESFNITAITKSGQIEQITISSGAPGTGDGIPTLIEFTATPDDPIVTITVDPGSWSGFAVDNIEYSPVPLPGTLVLALAGFGAAGLVLRRKSR